MNSKWGNQQWLYNHYRKSMNRRELIGKVLSSKYDIYLQTADNGDVLAIHSCVSCGGNGFYEAFGDWATCRGCAGHGELGYEFVMNVKAETEIARLTAENRALQAKIDTALEIEPREDSKVSSIANVQVGYNAARDEFRKVLEGK